MIQIKRLSPLAIPPTYGSPEAAGLDLYAAIPELVVLPPGVVTVVDTGWAVSVPAGTVGLVCSRSGLARRSGVCVLNAPGILDADYTGELAAILLNTSSTPYVVKPGDRVAQLVVVPLAESRGGACGRLLIEVVDELASTTRGEGGFGSTGR
jgi:dUTP pyrophosphatase